LWFETATLHRRTQGGELKQLAAGQGPVHGWQKPSEYNPTLGAGREDDEW
jgi:hypothetical protein